METLEQKIKKNAVNSGLLLGVIMLVLSIFTFYFITSLTTNFWLVAFAPIIFSILLPIVIVVFFCIDLRKKIGGFWTFKQATTGIAIMFFMVFVVQVLGRDLLFAKVIEPEMAQKMQTAIINATTGMMEKSGADQTAVDEKTASIQKQFDSQTNPTIAKTVTGYAIAIVMIFVLALIFGAIFKRAPLLSIDDAIDPAETTV